MMNRTRIVLGLLVLGASIGICSRLLGGGGAGGVDVYPSMAGPIGRGGVGSLGYHLITVHSPNGPVVRRGSELADGGILVSQHTSADVVNADRSAYPHRWSLDLEVYGPDLGLYSMPAKVLLNGRYRLLDRDETDDEQPRLMTDPTTRRHFLVGVVGVRNGQQSSGSLVSSFTSIQQVFVIPVGQASFRLRKLKAEAQRYFGGAGLDIAFGLLTRRVDGVIQQSWVAFDPDDQAGQYDVDIR